MLPMLAVGWRASAVRGEKAGRFRKLAGVSIACGLRSATVTLTVDSQAA